MKKTGNTILLTGGATGIGRALAAKFLAAGNRVIAASRSRAALDAAAAALPGLETMELDVTDAAAIAAFATDVVARFPDLNVLMNNAGIMRPEKLAEGDWLATAEAEITTNLLGPLRLTSALLPHLLSKPDAAILNVTSGLAFVPLVWTPTYSATKAALHSFTVSLRRQLVGTSVEVIEVAPPYVQTELMGSAQASDPRAMPLAEFVDETMDLLGRDPTPAEIVVGRCEPLRFAAERGSFDQMVDMLATL